MTRSLVTGGAGFLGSHVAQECLDLGHEVVVLDDLSGGYAEQVPVGAEFLKGSITDRLLLANMFSSYQFDYVYHLAAYAAEGLSHFVRHFNYENNVIGSVNLINEAVKNDVKCFVFTSSIAVYGANQVPMREDMVPQPEDPYGIAKYAVELDLEAAHKMFGLNYVVFRPHNVYGEHQNLADKYRNVVGIFMRQLLNKEPVTIFGDGQQTRAFSYVADVSMPIAIAAHEPNAWNTVFNIGADQPYTVLELANAVAEALQTRLEVRHLPARQEVVHAWSDHSRAHGVFPRTHTALTTGLGAMAEWARTNRPRRSRSMPVEVARNLPEVWRV